MARPLKKNLEYFSFDSDFFSDGKIKKLRNHYGATGVIIYIYLVTYCYKENGYYLIIDEDLKEDISEYFRISTEMFKEIFEYIIEINLFQVNKITKDITVISSERIQRNYQAGVRSRGKKNPVKVNKYIWILSEEETEDYINIS